MIDLIMYALLISLILLGLYVMARDIVTAISKDKTYFAIAVLTGIIYIALSWHLGLSIDLVYLLVTIMGALFLAELASRLR